ncbi:MAG: chemotaxis protein CheW [Nitrospirota bacterium]
MSQKLYRQKQKKRVDWGEVLRRTETLKKGPSLTSEEKKRILRDRAKSLAKEPEKVIAEEYLEIIEFALAYERYGIESSYIHEVYPLKDLTPLPCTPPFMLGIINVRGKIISVIDIKKFFGMSEKGLTDLNRVIIVKNDKMEIGILADAVLGARPILTGEIQPSIPTFTGIREEYLRGITKDRVVILDIARLISDKRIVVHEEV